MSDRFHPVMCMARLMCQARGASYGSLPAQLQYKVSFQFQSVDPWGFATGGTPITLPFPSLNNEKVTVSYRPATPADEQVLASLLPAGTITNINRLPTNIPAYLIKVIPELKVNGQVVMSGAAVQMGTDHKVQYTIQYPDGRTRGYASNFEAGTFHSVGIVGGSISKDKLQALQTRVSQLQTDLYAGVTSNATKESILGDTFYAGTLGYFAKYAAITKYQSRKANVEHILQPSIGTIGLSGKVSYFFGFPRNMSPAGVVVDVGKLVTITTAHNGNAQDRFNFVFYQAGMLGSGLEHQVVEKLFFTAQNPVEGVSAVKLINLAQAQGIPVYHINQANKAMLLPQLQLSANVMAEIQAGLASGKEVIAPKTNMTVFGWTGAGYIIYDPVTGDGAYRISGGANGAFIALLGALLIFMWQIAFVFLLSPAVFAVAGASVVLLAAAPALLIAATAFIIGTIGYLITGDDAWTFWLHGIGGWFLPVPKLLLAVGEVVNFFMNFMGSLISLYERYFQ